MRHDSPLRTTRRRGSFRHRFADHPGRLQRKPQPGGDAVRGNLLGAGPGPHADAEQIARPVVVGGCRQPELAGARTALLVSHAAGGYRVVLSRKIQNWSSDKIQSVS